jgi:UDP-N-acetylmuramoyl-tripeptide--D-alanyl-D-alanine ligase
MRLADLVAPLQARLIGVDVEFTSLSTDSRQIRRGELFVALSGENFDGHDFASVAADRGACAMVVEREIDSVNIPQLVVADALRALATIAAITRHQFRGQLIAVTGSSGKTSVKGLLREIFAVAGTVVATPGNFNNHIGVPLSLMNHPGEIGNLVSLAQPDIALVNNVSAAHIAGFGSLAAIAKEKGSIYSTLNGANTAIINLDDAFAADFIRATAHVRQIGFSLKGATADFSVVRADNIVFDASGRAAFDLHYQEQTAATHVLLPGLHNLANALAAAACAVAAGVHLSEIAKGLANFAGEKGRLQIYQGPRNSVVVDDTYNANPGSVRAAIDYLGDRPGKRILVLGDLGELGDAGPQEHRNIGLYAAQKNITALFSHGPLSDLASAAFGEGGVNFPNKAALVEALLAQLDAQSIALIKGSRSTRMEEVVQRVLDLKETSAC